MIYKMHGTENKFYLIDLSDHMISDDQMRLQTIELCKDGTDGVLYVCPSEHFLTKMRIFNADGSEPEMCGNGLRCFARYVLEKHSLSQTTIETLKAHYDVALVENFHGIKGIQIKLYPVKSMAHKQLSGYKTDFEFAYYNVSNPHIVAFTEDHISEKNLIDLGQYANEHFDEGMNVNMTRMIEPNKIYVQTYERGVGITKSCGTGMTSASVHYAIRYGKLNETIEVYNDGGMIECKVEKPDDYSVWFTGNATYISQHDDKGLWIRDYKEQSDYEAFYKKTRTSI